MWQKSYETEAIDVLPEQIWQVWSDINRWHEWDEGIEFAKTSEPFQKGCRFELQPKGGPKVMIEIIDCEPDHYFTDLTRFPLAKMYGRHEMELIKPGRIKLKTTMTLKGPLSFIWRRLVAQKIVDDLAEDTARIIAIAKKQPIPKPG